MVTFIKANFRELEERLSEHVDKVDGILYDLGVSSPQLDEAERGFSYHQDAPLICAWISQLLYPLIT